MFGLNGDRKLNDVALSKKGSFKMRKLLLRDAEHNSAQLISSKDESPGAEKFRECGPPGMEGVLVLVMNETKKGQNNGLQIHKPHQEDHPRNAWRLRSSLRLVHLETQDEDPTWGCQRGLKRQNTQEESGATTQRHCGKTAAGNVLSPACSTSVHTFPPSGSLA
ncbi:hypothetical protein H8959_004092 [Pygathrix nigripes]